VRGRTPLPPKVTRTHRGVGGANPRFGYPSAQTGREVGVAREAAMVTVLFEDRPRTRMEPLGRGEGLFEFYDSCARPGYDEFRSIVNAPSESGAVVGGRTVTLTLDMSTAVTADTSGGLPTLVLNDGGRRPMTPTPRPRRPAQRDLLDKGGAGADWSKHNRHPLINKGDIPRFHR
jgi:hypothetical protein